MRESMRLSNADHLRRLLRIRLAMRHCHAYHIQKVTKVDKVERRIGSSFDGSACEAFALVALRSKHASRDAVSRGTSLQLREHVRHALRERAELLRLADLPKLAVSLLCCPGTQSEPPVQTSPFFFSRPPHHEERCQGVETQASYASNSLTVPGGGIEHSGSDRMGSPLNCIIA